MGWFSKDHIRVQELTSMSDGTYSFLVVDPSNIAKRVGIDDWIPTLGGAKSASGLLFGVGTTAAPATTSTADAKFIELRCQSSAATGDNRLMYLRYSLAGAGGGECLRALTRVDTNVGTAHGAHLSLSFVNTAGGSECSGLGAAIRGTLHIPNVASWAPTGTLTGLQVEIYSDGELSDPAGLTELSFIRVVNGGNATGGEDVDDDADLFSFQGFTIGANNVFFENAATVSHVARCNIGGTAYYLCFANAGGLA